MWADRCETLITILQYDGRENILCRYTDTTFNAVMANVSQSDYYSNRKGQIQLAETNEKGLIADHFHCAIRTGVFWSHRIDPGLGAASVPRETASMTSQWTQLS